jgi:glucose/mannose transport system substrate-binding protein
MEHRIINRREFLKIGAIGAAAAAVAGCAGAPAQVAPAATAVAEKVEEVAPTVEAAVEEVAPTVEAAVAEATGPSGKLEIFSWWTSGGEIEALEGLYKVMNERYPNVEIVNAAIAGGTSSGGDMKAVLQTRMMGGDPPESFQVHLGGELLGSYVAADQMEPLDALYTDQGWDKVFPKELIEIASADGHPWSVPVNIHRSNMMWYNTKMLEEVGMEPPKTWDEWFVLAEALKAKGQPTLGIAESGAGFTAHVFETMMIAVMGPEKFKGLFNGTTSWEDPQIAEALEILKKALDYANPDFLNVSWGDINQLMAAGNVAMIIQGDWTPGVLWSMDFNDFGWAPAPGNEGIYQMLSDSFGLPKGVKNPEAALAWLEVVGSKEGQDAFNPAKGSIPARTDADMSLYGDYHKWAMEKWKTDTLVPSIVHGAAAPVNFMTDFMNAINVFATNKDVAATQAALVAAAKDAGFQE